MAAPANSTVVHRVYTGQTCKKSDPDAGFIQDGQNRAGRVRYL